LSNLLVLALIDGEFQFEIPKLCSIYLLALGFCFVKFTCGSLLVPDLVDV
jgi:hypothetical protein